MTTTSTRTRTTNAKHGEREAASMIPLGRRASNAREVTLREWRKPAYDASRESCIIKKTQFILGGTNLEG